MKYSITLHLVLLITLLPLPAAGGLFYVNACTGNDSNTCTHPDSPCRTIKAALGKTPTGTSTIRIARYHYVEEDMAIDHHHYITFEGGWNDAFTQQDSSPGVTRIEPGSRVSHDFLFNLIISGGGQWASMTLKNLLLVRGSLDNIPRAIEVQVTDGAKAWLTLDSVHITGFIGHGAVISNKAFDNGILISRFSNSSFSDNPGTSDDDFGSGIFTGYTATNGSLAVSMEKVTINHNGFSGSSYPNSLPIWLVGNGGTLNATIKNTVIAGNRSTTSVSMPASGDGNVTVTFTNCTITENTSPGTYDINTFSQNSAQLNFNMINTIFNGTMYCGQSETATLSVSTDHCLVPFLPPHSEGSVTYTSADEIHSYVMGLDDRYHLQQGSPAIDTGICGKWSGTGYTRIAPYDDIDGDKRPGWGKTIGCDIGADEYKPFPWPMFLPAIIHQ
jgi:hypothetical protein